MFDYIRRVIRNLKLKKNKQYYGQNKKTTRQLSIKHYTENFLCAWTTNCGHVSDVTNITLNAMIRSTSNCWHVSDVTNITLNAMIRSTSNCGHASDVTNITSHAMIRCKPYPNTVNEDFPIGAMHGTEERLPFRSIWFHYQFLLSWGIRVVIMHVKCVV